MRDPGRLLPLGALALIAIVLAPARFASLRGDDGWNFVKRGMLALKDESILTYVTRSVGNAVTSSRPQLLGFQGGLVTWAFDGVPMAYHLFLVALTVAASGLLYLLVRTLGADRITGVLVLVVLAGAIQFRSYHDAVLGYYGTIEIILILTLASLLVFVRALRTGRRKLYVWAFLIFLPCPMLYEVAYPLVALYLVVALIERRGVAALKPALPYLVLGAVFTFVSFFARQTASEIPPGYEVNASVWRMLRTYVVSLLPPVPPSNLLFTPTSLYLPLGSSPTPAELLAGAWRGALAFALVLGLLLAVTRRTATGARGAALVRIAAVGATLWLTPTLLLAPAPKYQQELGPGTGYLPVLIQVFGVALVVAAAIVALVRLAALRSGVAAAITATAVAAVVGSAAGAVGYNNMRVVALETPIRESRGLFEDAARHSLLDEIPDRSTVYVNDIDLAWPTGGWTYGRNVPEAALKGITGRTFKVNMIGPTFECPPADVSLPAGCATPSAPAAWMRIRPRRGGGSVILADVDRVRAARALATVTDHLTVFVEDDATSTPGPPKIVSTTEQGKPWSSANLDWQRTARGHGWASYSARVSGALPIANTLDDAAAQVSFTALGEPDRIVRVYGTKRLLP